MCEDDPIWEEERLRAAIWTLMQLISLAALTPMGRIAYARYL